MVDKKIDLSKICEEELLNLRICDLPLRIDGTWLQDCIKELYKELDSKGIKFKPSCYLADEWLTPEQEPVVGIPFFLADPTLMKIENRTMLEVEGGTRQWCAKLLRHETGHAINYAYRLYKRKKWQKTFGRFSLEYPDTYRFRPYSKNFVRHLEDYYAQYHPDEDFAETFAVWLTPNLDWRALYKGWKALEKLKFVDELINEIKDKEPLVKKGKKYWSTSSLRISLKNYYRRKRHFYAEDFPDFHDSNLKRIFVEKNKENTQLPLAYDIIKKYRNNILESISTWTGEKKYVINDLLKTITQRCRELKLLNPESESLVVLRISAYITTLIMNYMYTGRFRGKKCIKK
ncbi:MAG: hypothetical protein ISS45_05735 [Candidatus Omnitrophica bacterium]|nr:hypothetical protein [Candidatus Omnitrophota bacterium]